MEEVTAFKDRNGRLHERKRDAIEADFTGMMKRAWQSLPDSQNHGDPVALSRVLASDIYPSARRQIFSAISWLEQNISDEKFPTPTEEKANV